MRKRFLYLALALCFLIPTSGDAAKLANGLFISVASGNQTIGPFNIPDNARSFTLTLKRCTSSDLLTWPDANTQITLTVQVSFDGGTIWQTIAGLTSQGGIAERFGVEAAETAISAPLFSGNNRKARVFATIANGPLQTTLSLDVN